MRALDRTVPIVLDVYGIPQPKGSKTAFVRNGRAVLVDGRRKESREAFTSWRHAVTDAAQRWLETHGAPAPLDGPLQMTVVFHLPRPASTPRRVAWPAKKPDLDKLTRAVFDACTGLLFVDDSRICTLAASKRYADGRPPGCTITVEVLA